MLPNYNIGNCIKYKPNVPCVSCTRKMRIDFFLCVVFFVFLAVECFKSLPDVVLGIVIGIRAYITIIVMMILWGYSVISMILFYLPLSLLSLLLPLTVPLASIPHSFQNVHLTHSCRHNILSYLCICTPNQPPPPPDMHTYNAYTWQAA